ncbi:MAG TPA: pyridoxine 5'-phosphate synthase [Gemmatimonadaceae bacterium]|nr:pyridoxine 5'-phosphate synthase [Gemmatimonadaceae bacterium]
MPARHLRLYVNIDHVATLRQARGGIEPDPIEAAAMCEHAGADGITAHLREDRRHIQDADVEALATSVTTYFNLEAACTDEMIGIALRLRPPQVTLVPEKRTEITTEGGLDVAGERTRVSAATARLKDAGIRVSHFIDPSPDAVAISREIGADAVELHTGVYSNDVTNPSTLLALRSASRAAARAGLAVHAGHGLTVRNVADVAAITEIEELNIGHSIISRAVFVGLVEAVREVRKAMDSARSPSEI